MSYGPWKGDLTLKRAIEKALQRIESDGRMDSILVLTGSPPSAEFAVVQA